MATDAQSRARLEVFREITAGTARSIARRGDLEVEFSADGPAAAGTTLQLRTPAAELPPDEVALVRGQADAASLRLSAARVVVRVLQYAQIRRGPAGRVDRFVAGCGV